VLARHLGELLPREASVVDVGCGDGVIDRLVLDSRPDLTIEGLDVLRRPVTAIPVRLFDGMTLPYETQSRDVVVLIDVLHHAADPLRLLAEAVRVSRRAVLIKDHRCESWRQRWVLRFMDWVGNRPTGVRLSYEYWSRAQWAAAWAGLGLTVGEMREDLGLYPKPARPLFERDLHFMALLQVRPRGPGV